ncbi:MAG: hypothetical protein EBS98_09815 [Chitinophagia bacterium]|jgi:hypothetical protein|nr:hypothetical protein [Chitinophagia bacterium]
MKRSVIIRGSLGNTKNPTNFTQQVVDSIRSWHNDEVILSTWDHQLDAARNILGIDHIVISKDPGHDPGHTMRQYITYESALKVAQGEQILVTRTDILHFRNLFEYVGSSLARSQENLGAFTHKLVIGNMMTIRPDSSEIVRTFRPSDWFQCGWATDIHKWCGIGQEIRSIDWNLYKNLYAKQQACTEKLWFSLVLQKYSNKDIRWYDTTEFDNLAWHAINDNFLVLDNITTARTMNLNWTFQPQRLHCYYTEKLYNFKYNELCARD